MRVLEQWEYGDPEKVAIRKEEEALRAARACGQCAHKRSMEFRGEVVHCCEFKRKTYGRRCDLFRLVVKP